VDKKINAKLTNIKNSMANFADSVNFYVNLYIIHLFYIIHNLILTYQV